MKLKKTGTTFYSLSCHDWKRTYGIWAVHSQVRLIRYRERPSRDAEETKATVQHIDG